MFKPYYVLKLAIDVEMEAAYQKAIQKNNAMVESYLQSPGPTFFDAGFDLFCPEKLVIAGRQTGKVDHQVKAAMEFVSAAPVSATPVSATPVSAAPVSAAPVSATPVSATPVSATPVSATPVGYYLYPRSSTGSKTPLRLANSVGIIDAGYRGHLIAIFDNWQDKPFEIEPLQRLAQICPPNLTYPMYVHLVKAEELSVTPRGEGGFGSTDQQYKW